MNNAIKWSSQSIHIVVRVFTVWIALLQAGWAEPSLNVVAWNLEWFPGHRPTASAAEAAEHLQAAQKALQEINPDVFIGIEVRDWEAFQELTASVPGLVPHVVSSFRDPGTQEIRPQQIGIASKLPCDSAWWEPWKPNLPNVPRGFSFTALEQPGRGLLMVYGNHLKSNRGSDNDAAAKDVAATRNEQTRQLLAHVTAMERVYKDRKIAGWIAAGDFNANHDGQFPHCKVVELIVTGGFTNTWADTPRANRLTWRGDTYGRYPPTTFDYVFTRGLGSVRARIVEAPRAVSDHYPVAISIPEK